MQLIALVNGVFSFSTNFYKSEPYLSGLVSMRFYLKAQSSGR